MRRLRYQVATSLDGFIAGPQGEFDWIVMDPDIDFAAMGAQFDTAVMGRKTFLTTVQQGANGAMPRLDVVVYSRTLNPAEYPDVSIVNSDPAESVRSRPLMFGMFFRIVRTESLGYGRSLADHMINSGLETVFARDFAGTTYPWTTYPPEVADWVAELLALPAGEHHPWMVRHPDGRRWIGIKAGAYLVDRAIQASGKSVVDLVSTPTAKIIEMAQGTPP